MKHTKTFSDSSVPANDVMGDESAVDHLSDGLWDG